jgi:hypothetical protein
MTWSSFVAPKSLVLNVFISLLNAESLATTGHFTVAEVFPLPECHITGTTQSVAFEDCFFGSLSNIFY